MPFVIHLFTGTFLLYGKVLISKQFIHKFITFLLLSVLELLLEVTRDHNLCGKELCLQALMR